jgi:hypothetical protein
LEFRVLKVEICFLDEGLPDLPTGRQVVVESECNEACNKQPELLLKRITIVNSPKNYSS